MASDLPPFTYTPLDTIRRQIRLVRILQFQNTDCGAVGQSPVFLEAFHFSIHDCPRYIALSYTWGDVDDKVSVILNGGSVLIPRNLDAFLRQAIRRRTRTGSICGLADFDDNREFLWIDALSINQNDIPERNEQVEHMKDIFEHAANVVVWLGPESHDSSVAIEAIGDMGRLLGYGDSPKDIVRARLRTLQAREWQAIRAISTRPWWTRAGLVQEATALPFWRILTYCGDQTMNLKHLRDVLDAISANKGESPLILDPITRETRGAREVLTSMNERSKANPVSDRSNTFTLLDRIRHREATDPRDRIYSIIGMASDREEINLHPDYALEVWEVYTAVAARILSVSSNLNVINSTRYHRSIPGLPSWVPDWSPDNTSGFITRTARVPNFSASSGLEFHQSHARFSDSGRMLHISGVEVDQISSLGPARYPAKEGLGTGTLWQVSDLATINVTFRSWNNLVLSEGETYEPTGGSMIEAFERTMCADLGHGLSHRHRNRSCRIPSEDIDNGAAYEKHRNVREMTRFRRLAMSLQGYMGLVPTETEVGDFICILFGGQTPYILRKIDEHWLLIGDCYVHGIMDGEAVIDEEKTLKQKRTFDIW